NISTGQKKKDKLGFALVGLGNYAGGQLATALQETSNCYLAGIVTGTPEKEVIWAEKYDIPDKNIYNYDNFDEIADNEDIDVVYVVLPNSMHAEYTIRALQAGKHVTCEKPMATSYADCVRMVDAAKKAGRKLSIGYRLHYEPHHLEMMRIGQKNIYGELTEIRARFGFPLRDKNRWRLSKEMSGGGPLMDVGIYCLQAAIYTSGELPLSLTAENLTMDKDFYREIEGTLGFQFNFPSGLSNYMETSYEKSYDHLDLTTDSHQIGMHPTYGYRGLKSEINGEPMNLPNINQQAAQMDAFSRNIMENTRCLVPGEMGARDMYIIDRIYEAMDSGREVSLKGIPQVQHLL
ncbi:MAG: Gfo/Idh/MocA family oxidoreductase, partial [Cyclobacteriaceae bacterium]